jgi:HK97 family phage major capsid protein
MSKSITELTDDLREHLQKARALAEAAEKEGRDFTTTERETVAGEMDAAREIKKRIEQAKGDEALTQAMKELGAGLIGDEGSTGPVGPSDAAGYVGYGAKSTGFMRLKSRATTIAGDLARNMKTGPDGRKALLTDGSSLTGVQLDPTILEQGRPAGSILDVLPSARVDPAYRFLRQDSRTNNAATVAKGGTKPTSTYTIKSVDGSLHVVAHLSEPLDVYDVSDTHGALESFIASELGYGLTSEIEDQVINTVNNESGINVQTYNTNLIRTSRKSVTTLQKVGIEHSFWIMSADDWENFELLTDSDERFYKTGVNAPVELAGRRLWSAPVVVSPSATTGTAFLFGEGSARLATDGQVSLRWSDSDDTDFEKNQVRARLETRINPDVLRPWAIVKVLLTESSSSS